MEHMRKGRRTRHLQSEEIEDDAKMTDSRAGKKGKEKRPGDRRRHKNILATQAKETERNQKCSVYSRPQISTWTKKEKRGRQNEGLQGRQSGRRIFGCSLCADKWALNYNRVMLHYRS